MAIALRTGLLAAAVLVLLFFAVTLLHSVFILPVLAEGEAAEGDGWYLLQPSIFFSNANELAEWARNGAYLGRLGTWNHVSAFDTATECEAARDNLIIRIRRLVPSVPGDGASAVALLKYYQAISRSFQALESKCVSVSDPRLAR